MTCKNVFFSYMKEKITIRIKGDYPINGMKTSTYYKNIKHKAQHWIIKTLIKCSILMYSLDANPVSEMY